MPTIDYNINFIPTLGAMGTLIEYKKASESSWTVPSFPANPTTLATYPVSLETQTTYYVRLTSVGGACAPKYKTVVVDVPSAGACCPEDYTLSPDETYCYQENEVSPTIVAAGYCLAPSPLTSQYSSSGALLYDPGYSSTLVGSSTLLSTQPQWKEISGQIVGPMNRESVWVDTDCDGNKDALAIGQSLQITEIVYTTVAKTVFVGIGGDNAFKITLNGTTLVECTLASPAGGGPAGNNFNFWHLVPINLSSGYNYITMSALGDGTTNDSFAAVIYDNSAAELSAAVDDSSLTILFQSSSLRGQEVDIATCPGGYFLDTSAGSGGYVCKQILTTPSIDC